MNSVAKAAGMKRGGVIERLKTRLEAEANDVELVRPVMPVVSRVWAMPSRWTFQVKPLIEIVRRYRKPGETWIDPFAGWFSPAEITNDLNPDAPTQHHVEALFFCQTLSGPFDGAIFDPPYSLTQVSRSYKNIGLHFKGAENPTGGFPAVRDELSRLVRVGGHVVSFGWNTVGMGKKRGFEIVEILICSHGGNRNDTLVTVEIRV